MTYLSAESGVAVIEEHGGVTGALDGGHLGRLGTFPGGTVGQSVILVPGLAQRQGHQAGQQEDSH